MLADLGTTWTKLIDEDGAYHVLPTRQILTEKWFFNKATGHLGEKRCQIYTNELEALGVGALAKIQEDNFTVVDVGSRDTKFLQFENRKVRKLDWNQSCGSSTGFTLELLMKYYEIAPQNIAITPQESYPLTCAVFGMEKIFDAIISGQKPEDALGRFLMAIARNVFEFVLKPQKIYLSGGLSENPAFVKALSYFCQTIPLGRFVLLDGLKEAS